MSRELRLNITSASNFEPHFGTRLRSDSEMADAENKVRYWVCCTKAVRKHPSSSLHSPSKFESWQVIHSARPRTPAQYTIVRIANTGCVLNARSTQEAIIAEETFSRKGGELSGEGKREIQMTGLGISNFLALFSSYQFKQWLFLSTFWIIQENRIVFKNKLFLFIRMATPSAVHSKHHPKKSLASITSSLELHLGRND
jgi:hypothetical protein